MFILSTTFQNLESAQKDKYDTFEKFSVPIKKFNLTGGGLGSMKASEVKKKVNFPGNVH